MSACIHHDIGSGFRAQACGLPRNDGEFADRCRDSFRSFMTPFMTDCHLAVIQRVF